MTLHTKRRGVRDYFETSNNFLFGEFIILNCMWGQKHKTKLLKNLLYLITSAISEQTATIFMKIVMQRLFGTKIDLAWFHF